MDFDLGIEEFEKVRSHIKYAIGVQSTHTDIGGNNHVFNLVSDLLRSFYSPDYPMEYEDQNRRVRNIKRQPLSEGVKLTRLALIIDNIINDLKIKQKLADSKYKKQNELIIKLNNRINSLENRANEVNVPHVSTTRTYLITIKLTIFIFLSYLLYSSPVLLKYTFNVYLLIFVQLVLVAILCVSLLSKKTDYKTNILNLILALILVVLSSIAPSIIEEINSK